MHNTENKTCININGVDIEWDLKNGKINFLGISSALFWNDPSLLNMFTPLVKEVGKDMFCLQVAHSSSLGTKEDYNKIVTQFGNSFEEGFLNWGKAASGAGWGAVEVESCDKNTLSAKIIVHNPWELEMQKKLPKEERWGCPFIQGKIIGIFNHAFNCTCWANEKYFYNGNDSWVELEIFPHNKTLEDKINDLRELHEQEKIIKLKKTIQDALKEKDDLLEKEQILIDDLSKSEQALKLIFENAQVGLMYITGDRKLIKANKRLADIFGYDSPEEMINMSMIELHLNEQNYINYGKENFEPLQMGIKRNIEYQLKRKDGSSVWCELSGKAIDNNMPADMSKGVLWVINDISLRKQYQQDLAKSELLKHNIISNIPDLLWIKDINGVYLACNKRFEDFFGAKEEEIVGKTDYDFVDKDLADFFRKHDKNAMKSEIPLSNYEQITFASDGHEEYLYTTKTKVIDGNGELYGVLGIGRDLTSTKSYQDEIDKLNERYELTLDAVEDGIWDWDIINDELYLSKNWLGMLGYESDDIGHNLAAFTSLVHPDDIQWVNKEIEKHFLDPLNNKYAVKIRILCKDGTYKWILTRGKAILNEDGKPIRMLGYHTDITLEKEYQNQLKTQKEEFETIFHSSKDGIAVLNLSGDFVNCNQSYCDMLGYTKEELLNLSCVELSIPEDKQKALYAIEETIKNGYVKNIEKGCFTKEHETISVNMTASLLPDKERILIIAKDVSNIKVLEEQSKLASMGEMIGNIAHQWRQPLSVISTASTGVLFHHELGTLKNELLQKEMKIINENAQYLSKTIDDFKNFIKDDQKMENTSVKESLEYALKLTDAPLKNNYIETIVSLDDDTKILANKNELTQSFINIINNSKDALKEHTKEEERFLFITTKKHKDSLHITICDSGGGISDNIKDRIFEPYFTTKHQNVGTGIGLSMVNRILQDKYKAKLSVFNDTFKHENKDYYGACFQIVFKG